MSVTPSYPGLYIQEIPSNSHAIVPAPTSIAAFVGYSHPYKTKAFNDAIELFSFSDFETYFGGLFTSGLTDASLPRAVYQFFLNGGSTAWVYGLQPGLFNATGAIISRLGLTATAITGTATVTGGGIVFTALEPTDVVPMQVSIINARNSGATFDVVVTYGTRVETFRGVNIDPATTALPDAVINGASQLVKVAKSGANWGTVIANQQLSLSLTAAQLTGLSTGYSGADFLPAFAQNSSLDNVEIFNLLMTPGVTDNEVVSAAMAFAEYKRAFAIIDPPPQAPAFGISPPAPIDQWMAGLGGPTGTFGHLVSPPTP